MKVAGMNWPSGITSDNIRTQPKIWEELGVQDSLYHRVIAKNIEYIRATSSAFALDSTSHSHSSTLENSQSAPLLPFPTEGISLAFIDDLITIQSLHEVRDV